VSADGIRIVFGNRKLLTLLLFGWLAGFHIVLEGLAAPYAHSLHGDTFTVGLLMAAMPLGMVAGAFLLGRPPPIIEDEDDGLARDRFLRPAHRQRVERAAVCRLTALDAGWSGRAYQLAAAAGFMQAIEPATRARAFGLAQSGLYAVQGLGILAGGAVAQAIGVPLAVDLAGLVGVTSATMLAMSWTHLRVSLIQARQPETGA
jgi:hypothetical protein